MAIIPTSHRINRLNLRLQTSDQRAALRYRQQLNRQWPDILAVFDAAFEAIDSGGQWIHIPRIELNLEGVAADDLTELPQLVRQALIDYMQRDFFSVSNRQQGETAQSVDDDRPSSFSDAEEVMLQQPLTIFLFYVQTGRLPWFLLDKPSALNELTEKIDSQLPLVAEYLWRKADRLLYFRALKALSEKQVKIVLRHHVANDKDQEWRKLVSALIEFLQQQVQSADRSLRLQAEVFSLLARSVANPQSVQVLSGENPLNPEEWRNLKKNLPENIEMTVAASKLSPFFEAVFSVDKVRHSSTRTESPFIADRKEAEASLQQKTLSLQQRQVQRLIKQNAAVNHHLVPLAGLVLTYAYLPRLFKALDIDPDTFYFRVDGNKSASPGITDSKRAAAVLNFIASGEDNPQEQRLELVKILLGLPLEQPLAIASGLLSQEDKAETESMLRALISHWTALKNTSVATLQQSFLMREGYLQKTDTGWRLTIERKGYDVLLDTFPFSFTLVKLAWMPEPIQVNW